MVIAKSPWRSRRATVQQWDVSTGQSLPPLMPRGTGAQWFGFVDGGRIVTAAEDGTVQVWTAHTRQPRQPPVRLNTPPRLPYFAFSGDGYTVAVADGDHGTVRPGDVATGRDLRKPMAAFDGRTAALALSPDGHHLVVGYSDGLRL